VIRERCWRCERSSLGRRRSWSRSRDRCSCWFRCRCGNWSPSQSQCRRRHALRDPCCRLGLDLAAVANLTRQSIHLLHELLVGVDRLRMEREVQRRAEDEPEPAFGFVALLHHQWDHVDLILYAVVQLEPAVRAASRHSRQPTCSHSLTKHDETERRSHLSLYFSETP
jgi:hypothetical protein